MSRFWKAPWSTHSNFKLMVGRREKTREGAGANMERQRKESRRSSGGLLDIYVEGYCITSSKLE